MAQTHTNHPVANGAFPYADGDIVAGVSAKDATRGMYAVLPAPTLPNDLSVGLANALNVGLGYDFTRAMQSVANKAQADGKDVAEAVNAAAKDWKPDTDRSLNTIGAWRVKVARKLVAAALDSRGLPSNEKNVEANLPGFMTRRAAEINAALLAELSAGYAVSKKGKGTAAGGGTVLEDL